MSRHGSCRSVRRAVLRCVAFAAIAAASTISVHAQDFAVGGRANYDRPSVNGVVLDWCVNWGVNCGQPAADLFCRNQGHVRTLGFLTFAPGQTYVMGDQRICDGYLCGGFLRVECERGGAAPAAGGLADTARDRISTLAGQASPDSFARFYADISVLLASYGRQVGWIDGMDPAAPPNDPGRGVSSWDAHYNYGVNSPSGVADVVAVRLATLRGVLSAANYSQLEAQASALLAQYGG